MGVDAFFFTYCRETEFSLTLKNYSKTFNIHYAFPEKCGSCFVCCLFSDRMQIFKLLSEKKSTFSLYFDFLLFGGGSY